METESEKLIYAQDEPDIGELVKEYERCTPFAFGWNRLRDNEDIRFARWDNQNPDGKKHDTENDEAFPWEGASDSQVFLADSIIMENVAVLMQAYRRSIALAKGVEPRDHEQAAYRTKLLEWLTESKLKAELENEVELAAQYRETYGVYVLHPTWEREVKLKADRITLQKLAEVAEQAPESQLNLLVQLIANEDTEDQAVLLVQEFGKTLVQTMAASQLQGEQNSLFDNYKVSTKVARKFVREMRSGRESSLPMPYICSNQPCIQTLKLWDEVFIPPYVTDIQRSPRVFVKYPMSETDLRATAALEGWDEDWVEQAVKEKGRASTWTVSRDAGGSSTVVNVGGEPTFVWLESDQTDNDNIEVMYAYTQELDENDIPCIYYTVFHANITKDEKGKRPLYAKRDKLNYAHKKMPFVVGKRERWNRSLTSSRGVPQLLASRQREIKVQRDSLVDSTSISTLPPIHIYASGPQGKYKFGPAVRNTVLPGREPKALELPVRETTAFELMKLFGAEVKEEMGILSEEIPPARVQVKQQAMVSGFLGELTEAFQQMFALIEQYMPDEAFMEITGSQTPLPKGEEIALQKDFILTFDVREMDVEHILKEFKAIVEGVLPWDREGVISASKLVRAMLRAINPALAKEITLDGNQASQQIVQRVETDMVNMFAGMPPRLTPDDNPTASAELQAAQEILQRNQKMQKALMEDPDFQQKFQQWVDNRQFNVTQNQNKQTGRTGVQQAA